MELSTELKDGKTIIRLSEERLDAHNSGEFRDKILALLDGGGKHVIVDLSAVSFIDSSGLGALLSGYKNATLGSGSFVLACLQPRVMSMFELTRLHRVFEIFPTVDDALGTA
ncbi:MAG: STAS domain-containing protein [Methylococcaceae bacterium]|jgi:anti-sigma B factor antagonist